MVHALFLTDSRNFNPTKYTTYMIRVPVSAFYSNIYALCMLMWPVLAPPLQWQTMNLIELIT